MTLAGTRPILPDELEQYELHHRARIAIKPGITGMWQVSGRSDITDLQSLFVINESYKEQIIIFDRTPFDNFMYYIMREMEKKHFMYDRNKKNSILMEYGNIIEKEQNKFDLIFKVKRKYENTNESTTWVSINERKRVSALYKEQEYNFIPKYSEIYEIGSETFVDDVTVAAEKMAQKIYDYYYM